jgi:cation diffusion facilitator family transporter
MAKITTHRVVLTAMLVDIVDIVTNTFVAIISGSAVMLVEAMAGLADCFAMLLLLIGNKRSLKRATKLHPFGHGKEQYFWATLAGFIILAITATISFYFGWQAFKHPEAVSYIGLTWLVLTIAVITNGYAFRQAARKLLKDKPWRQLVTSFNQSWDVASKTALVLDAMGTVSALIGLISLVLYGITGRHTLDGIGAMAMAIAMALFAILLLIGVRSLIAGQSVPPAVQEMLRKAVSGVPEVHQIVRLHTMILGSESMLANIDVNFKNDLTTDEIERAIEKIKRKIRDAFPDESVQVNVEPSAPAPEENKRKP